jgi:hypothetical protein
LTRPSGAWLLPPPPSSRPSDSCHVGIASPRSYASRKAYAEARPRVKGRFAKRGTLPGDEGYVPPGPDGQPTSSGGSIPPDDGLDDFMGLLTAQGFGGGPSAVAPPLQSPLAWLRAEGHL